jgi:hypothetical protein
LAGLSGERLDPQQAEQLDLIQGCVSVEEPGGGHLIEMLRALMGQLKSERTANKICYSNSVRLLADRAILVLSRTA